MNNLFLMYFTNSCSSAGLLGEPGRSQDSDLKPVKSTNCINIQIKRHHPSIFFWFWKMQFFFFVHDVGFFFLPILYLDSKIQSFLSLYDNTFIWFSGATSNTESGFKIVINPQSDRRLMIRFLRCTSLTVRLACLPSNAKSSLK